MNNLNTNMTHAGRPRDEAAKSAIMTATMTLLKDFKFANLTIERIAKEAGVGKATIYRWWGSKENLLLETFLDTVDDHVVFNQEAPLLDDFKQVIVELTVVLDSALGRALITAILEDRDLLDQFHQRFFEPRRQQASQLLRRGIDDGLIKADINIDVVLDMLFGDVYMNVFFYGKALDTASIDVILTSFMKGIMI
ncbi:TetR/AcrR family transcriptional regulator [Leuconostoc citreum]|uniref:Transcriptional regulator, AcrR family n=1 Tax=Leuconostoc citreum (strain KM20) TaxID=349519 RepID=B1MXA7_LEUCK|nr:TetR/AcrR family transcriptional regulator [Leuconostoc citreum]ACA82159.1 Transcriptional regulator, AcrR family [Leuconostoc citreum KM20]MCP1276397.1 TetR/AcrR family transcriptional regulator [Leuconostoc citreum]MCS8584055.1 TetR/AcrR family transcriptional regulator [Leuconostoc citreum]MCS8600403.1 TetR/AcrR family transcriptional regulator [Leuconostoc citreum]QGN61166.1 TetR family transcriptional regulator [Leuconostoc citreum]